MLVSLEARAPFLDHELVELAASLPPEFKLNDGGKGVLKDAARLVVPGLYGFVSATKWVVDLELTRFDRAKAFWTERGWSARAPIKTQSRIDSPDPRTTRPAGPTAVGGVAWAPLLGISAVEVRVDLNTSMNSTIRPMMIRSSPTLMVQCAPEIRVKPTSECCRVSAEPATATTL